MRNHEKFSGSPSLGTRAAMSPCNPGPSHKTSGLIPCTPDPHEDLLPSCSRPSISLGYSAWLNASLGSTCLRLPAMTLVHASGSWWKHALCELRSSCNCAAHEIVPDPGFQKPTSSVAVPAKSPAALLGWPSQRMAARCTICITWSPSHSLKDYFLATEDQQQTNHPYDQAGA